MPAEVTVQRYTYVYRMLCEQLGEPVDSSSARTFGVGLGQMKLAKATRRFYASAARFCIADPNVLSAFNTAFTSVEAKPVKCIARRRQAATVPDGLFDMVVSTLQDHRASWSCADNLIALIVGMRHFGLRPREWDNAGWADGSKSTLLVHNAKHFVGTLERGPFAGSVWNRGNGETRELYLDPIHREELALIADQAIRAATVFPYSLPNNGRVYRRTHQWALRAIAKLHHFPAHRIRQVSIYSYRHLFAAEAKATVSVEAGEVAALMGHISSNTAMVSYAPRTRGAGRVRVTPTADSVESVKVLNARFIEPSRLRKDIDATRTNITPNPDATPSTPFIDLDRPSR